MADVKYGDAVPVRAVCVGTEREVGAMAAALSPHVDTVIRPAAQCLVEPDRDAVHILFNEFRHDLRDCARTLVQHDIATIYAIDGILEWRSSWESPEGGSSVFSMRPVISHKVACIGRSQARMLSAWGNAGRCEVVGMPRLDALVRGKPGDPNPARPVRVLVATANNPGFDAQQVNDTLKSLLDLDAWARLHPLCRDRKVEWIWRLTGGLEQAVRPGGRISNRDSESISQLLQSVDVVITTPSTVQLEAMLLRRPVALLDYHNRPHYVPAAWVISCQGHLDQVIPEMIAPPAARMLYQEHLLSDSLEWEPSAAARMAALVQAMHDQIQRARSQGTGPEFPPGLLGLGGKFGRDVIEMAQLFPEWREFANRDLAQVQAALQDCAAQLRQERARAARLAQDLERPDWLGRALTSLPGPRKLQRWYRAWRTRNGSRSGEA